METEKSKFEEYKLLHYFFYPDESLKAWINETNYINNFQDDWNTLMPVVEKIESLGYYSMIVKARYSWTSFYSVKNSHNRKSLVTIKSKSKIKNTYKAVVEFITWYNKNKLS